MRTRGTQFGWAALTIFLFLMPGARAQVTLGENTHLGLRGDAGFAYIGEFDHVDSRQLGFSFNGDLNGYYYNPMFLQFHVDPYYNQSRLSSNYNSLASGKGVSAGASLFSGSHTPIEVSFEKAYDNQGQFNVPGSLVGYETRGRSQGFNVGGGLLFEGWPTFHMSFGKSSSDFDVVGSPGTGSSDSRIFTLGSGYRVAGFNLSAMYTNLRISQNLPVLEQPINQKENSYDNSFQFSVNRQLWRTASFSSTFSRTHVNSDYAGRPVESTFNSETADLSMVPTRKLTLNFLVNYSSNLSAQTLASFITGGTGPKTSSNASAAAGTAGTTSQEFVSHYADFGSRAAYNVTKDLAADASYDHRMQDYTAGSGASSDVMGTGVGYSHALLGGGLGAHYGFSWYHTSLEQSARGHSGSVSYSHDLLGWRSSAGFQFSRNVATALAGYSQTGYGLTFSTGRRLGTSWNIGLASNIGKSRVNGLAGTEALITNYTGTLSAKKVSFSGGYGRSNGSSIPFAGGLVPVNNPVPIFLPALVAYNGNSYSVAASYTPSRHFYISANYAHMQYETRNAASTSDNRSSRYEVKSEYRFRQMRFNAGFSHLSQGIGTTFNTPSVLDVVYFGVTRHFDVF